ncbi:reverse transcriptase [Gossypium australe]|uniref:Reverse transcriptase n=1 Tax=Gossypium australe TaxID=47621 RepID=A0A5B6UQD8_9ROSI|nr:reverse transcriptase [Gossypium australe]
MISNLKIFSWNCQGCASKNFIRAFREYNAEYHPDIVCLLEPRVSGKKANYIIEQLGFNFSHRVEAVGFSGSIWVGWKDSVRIQILQNHPQFILLHVNDYVPNNSFFITFVYGSADMSKRKILWDGLKFAMPHQSTPWILMGDFNAILAPEDKRSTCNMGKRYSLFGNFVDSCELQDLGFRSPTFIWQRGGTSVRLDHALANDAWMTSFPQCLVSNLPCIKSDHRPILLSTRTNMDLAQGRPFRFLAGWTKHNNFSTFVKEKWNYGGNMADSLNNFTSHVKDWNKNVYGFLGSRKRQLLRSLNNIQKALYHTDSSFLAKQEMEVRDELENVLNHEELLWRQKARCDWLHLGDRNTKFFHSCTIKRRKFNRIIDLRISNGEWCSNQDILRAEAARFFENLYGEVPQDLEEFPNVRFPSSKPSDITFLEKKITYDDIKRALFDMAPLKAPGSDGFHAHFFQSQWDILGNGICKWVKGVFTGQPIEQDLNNMLIVLIPKKECLGDFSEFRPMSLWSVMYKLITKVIANRFKLVFPNIISQEQTGFIAGRNVSDNIILAQEVIHSMRCKRNGKNWMAIKLDLEKAYGRVSWDFISASLEAVGVPEFLRKAIMSAISSSSMQILWNDVPTHKFKPARGIRQGCPLLRYMFVLCMDWLGHLIRADIDIGRWKLIQLSISGPAISHLFFADDLEVQNLGFYLGVPLLHSRVTKSTFSFVVEKIRHKLNSWNARKLSIAGKVTLAQSVLLFIPNYFMQSMLIPKGVCAEIERLIGFGLASKSSALWVRVLRAKYGWKVQIPDSINRSQCSHLRRSLAKVWPLLRENLISAIGDGASVRCWKDPWIPGAFSIGSAFWTLKEDTWSSRDNNWKNIWRYQGPQRVRFFLWLAFKQKLLTNSERMRRGIGQSNSCALCGNEIEDMVHVLRDCPTAKDMWMHVIPSQLMQRIVESLGRASLD